MNDWFCDKTKVMLALFVNVSILSQVVIVLLLLDMNQNLSGE